MPASPDNRAVSALFRAFGGAEGGCVEEACQHTPARASSLRRTTTMPSP